MADSQNILVPYLVAQAAIGSTGYVRVPTQAARAAFEDRYLQ